MKKNIKPTQDLISLSQVIEIITILKNLTNKIPCRFKNTYKREIISNTIELITTTPSKISSTININLTFDLNYFFSLLNNGFKSIYDFGEGPQLELDWNNLESLDELRKLKYSFLYYNGLENLLSTIKNVWLFILIYFLLLTINKYISYLMNKIAIFQIQLLNKKFQINRKKQLTFFQNIIKILISSLIFGLSIFQVMALLFQALVTFIENLINYLINNIKKVLRQLIALDALAKYQLITYLIVILAISYRISEEMFKKSFSSFLFRNDAPSFGYFLNSFNN